MKATYISKNDVPRRYTKWQALITEFLRSDKDAMEIDPEVETKKQIYTATNNIRRAIRKMHVDTIKCMCRGDRIYLIKM